MKYILTIVTLAYSVTASGCDRERVVNKQRLHGDDVRLFQGTPAWDLAKAIEDEDTALIRSLVATNASVLLVQDSVYGNTPLMLAASMFKYESLVTLLELDTGINARDSFNGATVLIDACETADIPYRIVDAIIRSGGNVNDHAIGGRVPSDQVRNTPLTAASHRGRADLVSLLLANGAKVNDTTNQGITAFSSAIGNNHYRLALSLIEHGAEYTRPLWNDLSDGRPIFLFEMLRRDHLIQIGSREHQEKMELVAFLKTKGLDYDDEPIPEWVVERVKKEYPATWQEFLKKY